MDVIEDLVEDLMRELINPLVGDDEVITSGAWEQQTTLNWEALIIDNWEDFN